MQWAFSKELIAEIKQWRFQLVTYIIDTSKFRVRLSQNSYPTLTLLESNSEEMCMGYFLRIKCTGMNYIWFTDNILSQKEWKHWSVIVSVISGAFLQEE